MPKEKKVCVSCSWDIEEDSYYESTAGDHMCRDCGDEILYTPSLLTHDEYRYIDGEEGFDGGAYQGTAWARRQSEGKKE
jgi:predicted RNA-binding Zn-ribbon protein involved in translation (DUF1610 family)